VDVGSVRHWPRMTHDQLARVFPNGRTVHVPSDGQPLPGYALALADIEKRGSSPSGMSLAAARNAGAVSDDRIASAGPKKGGILSKLFGFSTDEDEDEGAAPAPAPRVVAARPAEEPVAARVPMPQARPATIDVASRNTKPAGGFALASATSVAVTLPPARDVPRPPAEMAGAAAARAETTASITSWLNDADFGKPDRVPTNVALAYAANAAADTASGAPSLSRLVAPMSATTQIARIPPKAGQRYNDPWMRGITLATSVHYGMNVTVYGKLDVAQVRMMMIKPVSTIAMGFGGDPYEGMQTLKFAGAAVTFLPTVTFGAEPQQRQASLVR
jgi:hypothetical protein